MNLPFDDSATTALTSPLPGPFDEVRPDRLSDKEVSTQALRCAIERSALWQAMPTNSSTSISLDGEEL